MLTPSEKQFLKDTADQFRVIRLNKKISQRKVYKDTGINIIRIESGKDNLTLITLKQLCSYYQISSLQFNDQILSFNQQNNLPGINRIVNQPVNHSGSAQNPTGSVQNGNGSVQNGNGSVQNASDSVQNGNGSVQNASASVQIKNGSTQNTSVTIQNQSDSIQNSDGSMQNHNDSSQNTSDSGQNHSDTVQKIRQRIQNSIPSIQNTNVKPETSNFKL